MKTFRLKIASPDGEVFAGEAVSISLRGAEGDLAVMAEHIPFVTSLQAGKCKIELPDGEEKSGTVDGGLLTVSAECVTVLSGSFNWE